MRELIDREAVIDLLKQMRKDGDMVPWEGKNVFARIRKLPTIQPEKAQLSQEGTTSDMISRQAARHVLCKAVHNGEDVPCENQTASCLWTGTRVCDFVREIDALPSVQPEAQEGHWIWVAGELMCSECRTIYSDLYPDYDNAVACPHCGARMKGEQDDSV